MINESLRYNSSVILAPSIFATRQRMYLQRRGNIQSPVNSMNRKCENEYEANVARISRCRSEALNDVQEASSCT